MFRILRRAYHSRVIDHYERPRNVGSLDPRNPNVGSALVGAPACGDVMKLDIEVDANGIITQTKFKTFGCGSAIASSSVASEWIKGKTLDDALQITNKDIAAHLKLPPVKLHCSMLAEDAIKMAVDNLQKKNLVELKSIESIPLSYTPQTLFPRVIHHKRKRIKHFTPSQFI